MFLNKKLDLDVILKALPKSRLLIDHYHYTHWKDLTVSIMKLDYKSFIN